VPIWQITGAALLLVCVSVLVIRASHKRPYLGMGWLWYLGTLVPVIGLVQVGLQAMADRYTYVPLIGLFIMIVWGVPDILKGWRHRKTVFVVSAGLLFSVLAIITWAQVQCWQSSITLYKHTLEVTSKNSLIHYNLGVVLLRQGRSSDAITHLSESLRIEPDRADAHNNLGVALARQGKIQEAMVHYAEALRIQPDYVEAYVNIGNSLAQQGRIEEAIAHYNKALQIKPNFPEAHFSRGLTYLMTGNRGLSMEEYEVLKKIRPDLANALLEKMMK
jgi:tetratricopeptide (TPR) repeat protein